ncbi:hypothetical protein A2U01_0080404 [Trifolium medium]|uniref:Uncharacterized protein n=1 Tax=Trifolium medium TaxID=97028 RepID=A0A392TDF5_9FABA|nr:hypothetical protein [Trifolium medium]
MMAVTTPDRQPIRRFRVKEQETGQRCADGLDVTHCDARQPSLKLENSTNNTIFLTG